MEGAIRPAFARTADGLTLLRFLIALALAPLIWSGQWVAVALLLGAAWLSDFMDGKLARRAGGGTKLGRWDMSVDTALGAALVIGLVLHGTIPDLVGLPLLVVLGALYLSGNIAAAMLIQLSGFVPTLLILWEDRPWGWWAPFAAAALIAILDWKRLALVNIPAFLRGLAGHFEDPWARPPKKRT